MRERHKPVAVAAGVAVVVALLGGVMTDVDGWYRGLAKSAWTPPDWVFGPAWTLLYALAVVSAVEGWRAVSGRRRLEAWLVSLFFANAVLNVLWSGLFFTARRPDWALAEVATLWISELALVIFLWGLARRASLLLLPYLAWVGFAAYLNWVVVARNGPFG